MNNTKRYNKKFRLYEPNKVKQSTPCMYNFKLEKIPDNKQIEYTVEMYELEYIAMAVLVSRFN